MNFDPTEIGPEWEGRGWRGVLTGPPAGVLGAFWWRAHKTQV